MFIRNETEKFSYFSKFDIKSGAYFILHPDTPQEELIYVSRFTGLTDDGTDYFLEYPCYLIEHRFTPEDLLPWEDDEDSDSDEIPYFVLHYRYILGDLCFEIDSPQTGPFLPVQFDIEYLTDSDSMATNYLYLLQQ